VRTVPTGVACGCAGAAFVRRNPIPRIPRIAIPAIAIIGGRDIRKEIVSWQHRAKVGVLAIPGVDHRNSNGSAALGNIQASGKSAPPRLVAAGANNAIGKEGNQDRRASFRSGT